MSCNNHTFKTNKDSVFLCWVVVVVMVVVVEHFILSLLFMYFKNKALLNGTGEWAEW